MEGSFFTRHRRTLISIAVILVVALHAVPVAYPYATLWPIMHWGMYRNSKAPGPIFTRERKVFATTASGTTAAITPEYTGLASFTLERDYFRPMSRGDSAAPARLLAKLNQQRQADPFVEVRLEIAKYTATDSGIVKEDEPVIRYRAEPDSNRGQTP